MPRPSQVVALVEDKRHEMLVRRYLRKRGMEPHQMTFVPFSAGKGSAEQWVRTRFAKEVNAYRYRRRSRRAATVLIVMIDADAHTVDQRMAQLAQGLRENGSEPLGVDEPVARLVPKRNVETWILCLNEHRVDEDPDYKRTRHDWDDLIPRASEVLFNWTRPNSLVPEYCVDSLKRGLAELKRLEA
jgi:hypothetical protein